MRRNPEVNADTHYPSGFQIPLDGRLPTTACPAIDIASGSIDNNVYIQTIAIPPDPFRLRPGRNILQGNAEMSYWKLREVKGRQDYQFVLRSTFDKATEAKLLEIHDASDEHMVVVRELTGITTGLLTPADGFSLMVSNVPVFMLHPNSGTIIHPDTQRVASLQQTHDYVSNLDCKTPDEPYEFSTVVGRVELGDMVQFGNDKIAGPVDRAFNVIAGVRMASLIPEVLERKLFDALDKGVASPLDVHPIFEVYTKLLDKPTL